MRGQAGIQNLHSHLSSHSAPWFQKVFVAFIRRFLYHIVKKRRGSLWEET